MNKKDWSEEERRRIEADFAAAMSLAQVEDDYAKILAGELVPFEEVIRAVEEQQRRFDHKTP